MKKRPSVSTMIIKKASALCTAVFFALSTTAGAQEPTPSNDEFAPLVLVRIIPMPDVDGRFDHMGVDAKSNRVLAAVYGNDSLEVLDVARGKRIQSVHAGFIKPQMAMYLPESNRIVISSEGDGSCKILDGETYKVIDTVKFPDDADQLRYDPATKRVYVGYGDGAIGMFDATTNKKLDGDFELGVHPESFQLEEKGSRIFVKLASISQIAVIDRNTRKIEKWNLEEAGTNFPMALDEEHLLSETWPVSRTIRIRVSYHSIIYEGRCPV